MENAITVSEISDKIKNIIETDPFMQTVYVEGEISNYSSSPSGHVYFTLKDENAAIKCVMFKGYKDKLDFVPKDGMKVLVLAKVTVYKLQGYYQLQTFAMKIQGAGNLYEKLEQLKSKLKEEGLFDSTSKKEIPFMPKVIGVVTSRTGAVIRDIINVSTRRNPNVTIKLIPVSVQGEKAAGEIVKAIEDFNRLKLADVLIVGRGGGSIEDLWPFNEEKVARAIYNSEIPIISAVGHETDWTIADFVSDKRAPTPSAAAEIAVKDVLELKQTILKEKQILDKEIIKKVKYLRLNVQNQKQKLKDPKQVINEIRMKLDLNLERQTNALLKQIEQKRHILKTYSVKLEAYNVEKTLQRGYTLILKNGEYISSPDKLKLNDDIEIRFKDQNKNAKITK